MRWLAASSLALLAIGCAQAPQPPADGPGGSLVGPVWQLIRFRGGDDRVLIPGDGARYTLQFQADGRVSALIDCNRGSGAYKVDGSKLEFGPMAVTRAMCPPGSMDLHDHILKQLPHIRSYVLKDGRLFLSLMADGGTYEFQDGSR